MKNKAGLVLSFILTAPGVYAITRWFMLDASASKPTMDAYKSVLGFPEISFTKQIGTLLVMGIAGVYIAASSKDDDSGVLRGIRIALLLLGFATCSMLAFSLM